MGDRTPREPRISYASNASSPATASPSQSSRTQAAPQLDQIMSQISSQTPASTTTNPFDELEESEYLVLLTPFLELPPPCFAGRPEMDPFEPFGRSLAAHHARIRHAPYVARDGLREFHELCLDDAGGAVVVVCKPPSKRSLSPSQRRDSIRDQQKVAKAVSSYLENELGSEIPGVLVTIDAECKKYKFEASFNLDSWAALENAADTIFGKS